MHEGEHDLAHAGEVGGAGAPLQDGGDGAGVDAHRRLPGGVDDLRGGGEDDEASHAEGAVGTGEGAGQPGQVALEVARVGVEVLGGGELQGVDEDGDHDGAGRPDTTGGLAHEVEVALVEGAHRHDDRPGIRGLGQGGGEVDSAAGQDGCGAGGSGGGNGRRCGFSAHVPHASRPARAGDPRGR